MTPNAHKFITRGTHTHRLICGARALASLLETGEALYIPTNCILSADFQWGRDSLNSYRKSGPSHCGLIKTSGGQLPAHSVSS